MSYLQANNRGFASDLTFHSDVYFGEHSEEVVAQREVGWLTPVFEPAICSF